MFNNSRYTSNRALALLSDDQIRARAPSVFASAAHASRSQRYTYIPTVDILSAMRREGFFPVSAIQGRSRIPGKADFTKHQIRFIHGEQTATKVGDSIAQVILTNSHDGTSTYMLDNGRFRLVCLNGMMVAEESFQTLKIPHKGNIIDRVIEGSFQVMDQTKAVDQRIEQFMSIDLSAQEQQILANAALQLRFEPKENEQPPVRAEQVLQPRRTEDRGNDLWRTFNRIQEAVVRGGICYNAPAHRTEEGRYVPSRRMHTREVTGIDQNTALNRALWRLTAEMAALKAA